MTGPVNDRVTTPAMAAGLPHGRDLAGAVRPLMRGWMHLVCFFLAIPAGVAVIALASSPRARVAAVVYAVALVALFGVSAAYHRGPWSPVGRRRMQRLDHATIFVMIAGSYTPMCLLVLDRSIAGPLLIAVWTGAIVGGVLACRSDRISWFCRNALYIVLGWFVVIAIPQLVDRMGTAQIVLVTIGGLLYSLGALGLATRWPDPFPRVFGYHEVWHTLVVAAVVCQFIAIASVIHTHTPA